ncbi:hypothetical protein Mmc1_0738 [Magnetococcus marinus MC-1]|uniref:Uncharacterized protein n=1 Tax=Magnetococcus marinus (strain ATCC BAA-1437 / JCM 17883 / MC-1) TaxID=156889 RepID=A0L5L6_MAGMM|nr:hypothetical protein [Magnetococcus marinus]ABK43259.1 hypothetical protein Mmc1_0738 [Magnetococcus marinus MC-1]
MQRLILTLLLLLWPVLGMAATPGDVLVSVQALAEDLEAIRVKVGGQANTQPELPIEGASPREVFYQAESIESKIIDLLAQRANLERRPLLFTPKGNITPGHSLQVLEHARALLAEGRVALGAGQAAVKAAPAKATPSDVYKALFQANRQINLLLTRKIIPSDVFQRVEQSVQIAQLLNRVYGGNPALQQPALDLSHTPVQVYDAMLACFHITHEIMRAANVKSMQLDLAHSATKQVTPGDVYDLASLLYSELAHLYFALPNRPLTPGVFYAGQKKPGHVLQLAKGLEHQLLQLKEHVASNPTKLSH